MLYPILHDIFKDKTGGTVFTCFGPWHFFYLALAVILFAASILYLWKKDRAVKERVMRIYIGIAVGLYALDFFLMPFAYGEIDVDKLPFHACTAMCVMSFAANHMKSLRNYRMHFAMLAFLSNMMYLVYPAGVMWYEIHPLSYRVIQTLLFHTVMAVYALLAIVFDENGPTFRYGYRSLVVLSAMSVWAIIGNVLYSGAADGYDHDFNWFFVRSDPFGILPTDISHYIMPWVNIAVFFACEMLIALGFYIAKRVHKARSEKPSK